MQITFFRFLIKDEKEKHKKVNLGILNITNTDKSRLEKLSKYGRALKLHSIKKSHQMAIAVALF